MPTRGERRRREKLGQPRRRKRARGKVDEEEPGGEGVDEIMQSVGVRDAVYRCVQGEGENQNVGEEANANNKSQ